MSILFQDIADRIDRFLCIKLFPEIDGLMLLAGKIFSQIVGDPDSQENLFLRRRIPFDIPLFYFFVNPYPYLNPLFIL